MERLQDHIERKTNTDHLISRQLYQHYLVKRQLFVIPLAGFAGFVGSYISSLFTPDSLDRVIQRKQNIIAEQVHDNLVSLIQDGKDIQRLNSTVSKVLDAIIELHYEEERTNLMSTLLTATQVSNIVSNDLHKVVDTIQKAHQGTIDISSIKTEELTKSLATLTQNTRMAGFEMTTTDVNELPLMASSSLLKNDSLFVVIHIPIYRPTSALKLYSYCSIPLNFDTESTEDPVWVSVETNKPFIAIDVTKTFFVDLSTEELSSCTSRENTFFCPHLVRYKTSAPSCAYSLFVKNIQNINKYCRTVYTDRHFSINRIASNQWIVTTSNKLEVNIECPDQHTQVSTIQGSFILTLEKDCIANSDYFHISRPRHEADVLMESHFLTDLPVINLDTLGPGLNFTQAIRNELQLVGQPLSAGELKQANDFREKLASIHERFNPFNIHNLFSHLIGFIGIGLVALAIYLGFSCWKRNPQMFRQWQPQLGNEEHDIPLQPPNQFDNGGFNAANQNDPPEIQIAQAPVPAPAPAPHFPLALQPQVRPFGLPPLRFNPPVAIQPQP
jgi:hypothetical protein